MSISSITYNKDKFILIVKTQIDESISNYTVIDTKNETINYDCKINKYTKKIVCENTNLKNLDSSDVYTFKSIMENLQNYKTGIDKNLMKDILNMKFVQSIYLSNSAGSFVTPHKNKFIGYFFLFSTMIIPYQMIDLEIASKPYYIDELKQSFFNSNNKILYYLKEITRYVLILPGLIFTPFILITVLFALKNMS